MTDRDRLIELLNSVQCKVNCCIAVNGSCADLDNLDRCQIQAIADYLIENGVIVPPCKVGQVVYPLNADPRFKAFIERIEINTNGLQLEWVQYDVGVDCTETWDAEIFGIEDIGKTVFLNETEYFIAKGVLIRKEAERSLNCS